MSFPVNFQPFLLSPLEHYLYVSGIGAYGCNYFAFRTDRTDDAISTLKAGVIHLVQELPFLAGEIAHRTGDSRHRLEVRPSSADVFEEYPMIVVRQVQLPLPASDFGRVIDSAGDNTYRPLPPRPESFQPVLRFQANAFHGGIIFCFCWNHVIMDGTAIGNLIRILALCCRENGAVSLESIRQQQDLGRRIIADIIKRPLPVEKATDEKPLELHDLESFAPENIARETVRLSPCLVDNLKTACNRLLPPGQYCATNDVLMALYWVIGARASIAHGKRYSAMNFAISASKRCNPPIPESYLGSTLLLDGVQGDSQDIAEALSNIDANFSSIPEAYFPLLSKLASRIRARILTVDDEYLTRAIHELYEMPQWHEGPIKMGDLLFSSLAFNTCFQQDFGPILGPVVGFEPRTVYPNMTFLRPRQPEPGTGKLGPWELTLMFDPERLEMMKKDPLLIWVTGSS